MSKSEKRGLIQQLENEREILQCAAEFNMVGDPTRLKVCYLLCKHKELSVGEIADVVGVSISAVSHTLAKLKRAHIVRGRRSSKRVYYSLVSSPFATLLTARLKNV